MYLGLGLTIFGVLGIGKGLTMMYLYNSRLNYYKDVESLSLVMLNEEKEYTKFRLQKKIS
jgi:hypothetical protein